MILVAMLGIVAANVIMACLYKQAFYSKIYFLMMFAFSLFILLTASSLLYDDSVSGSENITGNLSVGTGLFLENLTGSYSNGEAYLCIFDNGTVFANDTGACT